MCLVLRIDQKSRITPASCRPEPPAGILELVHFGARLHPDLLLQRRRVVDDVLVKIGIVDQLLSGDVVILPALGVSPLPPLSV